MCKFGTVTLSAMALCVTMSLSCRADYDAAADFSTTNNPNGVWSYGNSATLGGAFNLFSTNGTYEGIDYWNFNGSQGASPLVYHNGTASPITYYDSILVQPGELALHPGSGSTDEFTIVRFTAPSAGSYMLDAAFSGIDFIGPTTTDVHVLVDGVSIFDGDVNAYGPGPSFSTTQSLLAGDTIDFVVGRGSNGTYNYDSTGLAADIRPVPEPASLLLLGTGFCAVMGYCRRRSTGA